MSEIYNQLTARLKKAYFRQIGFEITSNLLGIVMGFVLALLLMLVLENRFYFNSGIRTGFLIVLGITFVGSLIWAFGFPFLKNPYRAEKVAKTVGAHFPTLKDRLLNALQLYQNHPEENPFILAEFKELEKLCRNINFSEAISSHRFKQFGIFFSGLLGAVLIICFIFFNPLSASLNRLWHAGKTFRVEPKFEFISLSKDVRVPKGEPATLGFQLNLLAGEQEDLSNTQEAEAKIFFYDDEGFQQGEIKIFSDSSGKYIHKMPGVLKNGFYNAEISLPGIGELTTKKYRLEVLIPATVNWFQMSISPPAYTGLPKRTLEKNVGETTVIKGSKVSIYGELSRSAPKLNLILNDSVKHRLPLNSKAFSWQVHAKSPLAFQFYIEDSLEILSKKSPVYEIGIINDNGPELELSLPDTPVLDLPRDLKVEIQGMVQDDFGISGVKLHYRLARSEFAEVQESFQFISIPQSAFENTAFYDSPYKGSFFYQWSLESQLLVAGDEFEFFIEALDNDRVSGPKSARSDMFILKYPALDELFTRVEKKESDVFDELEKQLSKSKGIQKELNELEAKLKQQSKSSWQEKQDLESLKSKQKKALEQLNELNQKLEALKNTLQKDQLASSETLEKYQEIQKLLKELNDPKLLQNQDLLNKAIDNLNERQIREALKNMDETQKGLQESLDRTLNLLKRMKIDRKFDEAIERASAMIEKQRELQKQTREKQSSKNYKQLAREQSQLQEMHQQYQKSLKDLQNEIQNYSQPEKMPLSEMDSLNREQELQKPEEDIKNAQSELENDNPSEAGKKQQQMINKMLKQRSMLSQMKEKAKMLDFAFLLNYLKNMIQNAVELSVQQERLLEPLEFQPIRIKEDSVQVKIAQTQDYLKENLGYLQEKTKAVGNQSAQLAGQMMNILKISEIHMEKAISYSRSGYTNAIQREMLLAMKALNDFADNSANLLEKLLTQKPMHGQGGGESGQKQMRQLANEQSQLNQQTQGMQSGSQVNNAKRLAQLAAQQRLLEQQLQKIRQAQSSGEQSGSGEKLIGDLENLAKEMAQVAKQMESGSINQKMIEKQQKILSRMLDASMAIRQEKFQKEREAKSGKTISRLSPPDGLKEAQKTLVEEVLESLNINAISDDYRKIIQNYYKKVQKDANKMR